MNSITSKRIFTGVFVLITTLLIFGIMLLLTPDALAHSGRTDSSGGHRDNKNKSGLGYYHYHCGGRPPHLHSGGCPYSVKVEIKEKLDKITVRYDDSMFVGGNQQLEYNIVSDIYSKPSLSSSNSNIISVYGNELVAKGVGTATITIKSRNNSRSFNITVEPVAVKDISFSEEFIYLQLGQQKEVETTISPSNATDKNITWKVEDGDILNVEDGILIAKCEGTTTVWAISSNGIYKSIQVEVYNILPESIESSSENIRMEIIDTSKIKINILPENSTNKEFSVKVIDDNVVSISLISDVLKLTPLKEGKTEISITTWNGIEKIIPIEIYSNPIENVEISTANFPFLFHNLIDVENDIIPLAGIFSPENCTYKDLVWVVSNYDIADINESNELIIKNIGRITITCISMENKNIHNSIEIVIVDIDMIIAGALIIFVLLVVILLNLDKIKQWHCNNCKSDF